MKNICKLIVIFTLLTSIFGAGLPMKIHFHEDNTNAKCLDGSPAALYYAEGTQTSKTVIFFQGGGMCGGQSLSEAIDSCYNRSLTSLGSSKKYAPTKDSNVVSLLSFDEDINPLYYNWNKIFIPYCDGTFHQGSARNPIQYKGVNLFFRGSNNTIAHFQFANKVFNLYKNSAVVLTGISAGAIATFIWGNYLYHKLQIKNDFLLIPDSGIFISDIQKPANLFKDLQTDAIINITNSQTDMPLAQCLKDYGQAQCFNTSNLQKYIIPPLFIIESLYDQYSLKYIYSFDCIQEVFPVDLSKCSESKLALAEQYRRRSLNVLQTYGNDVKNGVWAISCSYHGFLDGIFKFDDSNVVAPYGKKPKTILQALSNFIMRAANRVNIDTVVYPNNPGCNGIKRQAIMSSQ